MKYFMKKIEKMLKSENDDVALQNRILEYSHYGKIRIFPSWRAVAI